METERPKNTWTWTIPGGAFSLNDYYFSDDNPDNNPSPEQFAQSPDNPTLPDLDEIDPNGTVREILDK